jgi:hypothetical protein
MNTRLLLVLFAFAFAGTAASCGTTQRAGTALPSAPSASSPALHPPIAVSASFQHDVEASIAGHLHSTLASLHTQLAATPDSTLMNLAKPLGLAEDQLAAIVRSSMAGATDASVRTGRWSHAQGAREKRYWATCADPVLIAEVSHWLTR